MTTATQTATFPAAIIRTLKSSQTAGRAAKAKGWHAIFQAHRATGLGKNPLHRALVKAEVVDYSLSTVGFVISDTASLPDDATVEQIAAAVTAGNLVRNTRTPKAAAGAPEETETEETETEKTVTVDPALSVEADLREHARQVRALVTTMGQDALPILVEVYEDAAIASTIYAAIVKANRIRAARAAR